MSNVAKSSRVEDADRALRTERQLKALSRDDRATFVQGQLAALKGVMAEAFKNHVSHAINIGRALQVTYDEIHTEGVPVRDGRTGAERVLMRGWGARSRWDDWLKDNFHLSHESAKLYMRLARRTPALVRRGVNIGI